MLLCHGRVRLYELLLDSFEFLQLLRHLVAFTCDRVELVPQLIHLIYHGRVVMPQVLVLPLQLFPLGRVPPHALLHALVVLLHQVDLLLQFR